MNFIGLASKSLILLTPEIALVRGMFQIRVLPGAQFFENCVNGCEINRQSLRRTSQVAVPDIQYVETSFNRMESPRLAWESRLLQSTVFRGDYNLMLREFETIHPTRHRSSSAVVLALFRLA